MIKTVLKAGTPKIFREKKGLSFTPVAAEVLLQKAGILTEGLVQHQVGNKSVFSGSTMLTIDLNAFQTQFRRETDRQSLLNHLKTSIFFRLALLRLARREAQSRCGDGLLGEVRTELEFKIEHDALLVDIDVLGDVIARTADDFGHGDSQ
ncbi:MAG: hypothetical protein JXX14_04710 [Deltaproteobacteria bacterium]|nr:hypothetical protein [Deltaproteobacteria bacterium]